MALTEQRRTDIYLKVSPKLTPKQRRRISHKRNREQKRLETPIVVKVQRAKETGRVRKVAPYD